MTLEYADKTMPADLRFWWEGLMRAVVLKAPDKGMRLASTDIRGLKELADYLRQLYGVLKAARECSDKALGSYTVVGATRSNPRYALAIGTMDRLRAALAALDGAEVAT